MLPFLTNNSLQKLRAMSNEDQRILDLQIEIYSYWKTMLKRLIDYVALATRTYVARQPISDGGLRCAVEQAVEQAAQHTAQRDSSQNGLLSLMRPSSEKRCAYETLKLAFRTSKWRWDCLMSTVEKA